MSHDELAAAFGAERARLTLVARRLLGSMADAEDAVQEAWLRLENHGGAGIENLAGWSTTVVGRICLDQLRTRSRRPTVPWHDSAVVVDDAPGPADEAELVESIGAALSLMLEALSPSEQLALVLHDVFGLPFADVGTVLGKSPDAAKMTASRARRKVRGIGPSTDRDGETAPRRVVDAFLAAGRQGDLAGLIAVLDPGVVLDVDTPGGQLTVTGQAEVAGRARKFASGARSVLAVRVAGQCGVLTHGADGSVLSIMVFIVRSGRIVRIVALADPARLITLELPH